MTDVMGIAGFVVALLALLVSLAHICWQVWWQHHQNKERVRAVVSLGSNPCVQVHNVGVIPVFVTGVELVVEGNGNMSKYSLQRPNNLKTLPQEPGHLAMDHWQFIGARSCEEPLQRGDAYNFALPEGAAPLKEFLATPDNFRIHIAVYSNAGELCRMRKTDALAYLAALASQKSSLTF